jgi:microcystin-dependent protein
MSNCTNCFNGCSEIISDKCVKYTGIDFPALGISNGDTLASVEAALSNFLVSTLNGVGIKPEINETLICSIINEYLPACNSCGGYTLNELLNAFINAICDIQQQVHTIKCDIDNLNADYSIGCLTGVTASSDTHEVVQAVINKLCELNVDLGALELDLSTNYVSIADINTYIQAYLDSIGTSTLISNKMVPYSILPYYGPLTNFDVTGAGTGDWVNIYLCNGNNNTPDLRGRTLVGTTTGMGGGAFNPSVDPAIAGNPSYSLGTTQGANQVTLTQNQIPAHTHVATSSVIDPKHSHFLVNSSSVNEFGIEPSPTTYLTRRRDTSGNLSYRMGANTTPPVNGLSSEEATGISVNTSNASTGGGLPHNNVQPSIGAHFIIYLP